MKKSQISLITIIFLTMIACSSSSKNKVSTTEKPKSGIYAPGNEELLAIQKEYSDVTIATLNEGYTIYTQGACINCHHPKNINNFEKAQWKDILDDMAEKASISAIEKDAVNKYVLAIKAVQSK